MVSLARTVYLFPPSPQGVGVPGIPAIEQVLQWPTKAPGAVEDFTLDCSAWLADAGQPGASDSITGTPTIAFAPTEPTATVPTATASNLGSLALTWLISGGTAGQLYSVGVTFSTAGGLTVPVDIGLPIGPEEVT